MVNVTHNGNDRCPWQCFTLVLGNRFLQGFFQCIGVHQLNLVAHLFNHHSGGILIDHLVDGYHGTEFEHVLDNFSSLDRHLVSKFTNGNSFRNGNFTDHSRCWFGKAVLIELGSLQRLARCRLTGCANTLITATTATLASTFTTTTIIITIFTTTTTLLVGGGRATPTTIVLRWRRWRCIVHHGWCRTIVAIITVVSLPTTTLLAMSVVITATTVVFGTTTSIAFITAHIITATIGGRTFITAATIIFATLFLAFIRLWLFLDESAFFADFYVNNFVLACTPTRDFHLAMGFALHRYLLRLCIHRQCGDIYTALVRVAQVRQKSRFFRIRN